MIINSWLVICFDGWPIDNLSVNLDAHALVKMILKSYNADYTTQIIYSQLFISFRSPSDAQLIHWLNYAEIGDVIGTQSLIYRRDLTARPSLLSAVSGSYDLHNGFFFFLLSFPLVRFSRMQVARFHYTNRELAWYLDRIIIGQLIVESSAWISSLRRG